VKIDPEELSIHSLLAGLLKAESATEQLVFNSYLPRLTRLATKLMQGFPSASQNSEDIAHSTLKSFMLRARDGQAFDLPSHDSLWALLAEMARHKAANRIRDERTLKRGGGRVKNAADCTGEQNEMSPIDLAPGELHPCDLDLACEELLNFLPNDELRQIAILLFQGHTQHEVMELLHRRSPAAIQRKVALIRSYWQKFLDCRKNV
jgi:DNA-directed RNA polymerase specialized sigma24 family protein